MQHRDQPTELAPTNAATAPATCDLEEQFVVCALYKFVALDNPARLQAPLLALLKKYDVKGSLHLAAEGLNGTLAARRPALDRILKWLRSQPPFCDLECKQSLSATLPFYRSKVKLKQELVTLGIPHLDPSQHRGTYVNAHEWNALLDDPDVLLIDTRNEYEISIGTFPGATNPHINQFRALPAYVDNHLDPAKHKKVAMFCTGGIRCEKSTAYLKQQGFDQVYHLKGGILQYLADTPRAASRWRGECFVFDQRVSVDHDLKPGHYDQCHACRHPISAADKQSEHYTIGVSCPHCWPQTAADKTRFAERQHQVELADARGQQHIGQLFSDDQ